MTDVVGVAVVRRARVLAARRVAPPEVAGRWELPGGKVRGAESREDAARRELREELGVTVELGQWLGDPVPIRDGLRLHVVTARLEEGEPSLRAHDRLRWLAADELDDVDWLEPDRPFVERLRALLLGEQEG